MRIVSVGGGPAGLYFSILMKKAHPDYRVEVYERNRPDDTFGFGVVFSDATLEHLADADWESYDAITRVFARWDEIAIHFKGETLVSTGHGFCGLSRHLLLNLLQSRARALGVELHFKQEVTSLEALGKADLILLADGVNSLFRTQLSEHFRPSIDLRSNRFCWLGTTLPLDAFTFIFKTNDAGLWRVHAYRYNEEHSTFIVEATEETWRRAGMESATEEQTLAYCQALFKEELKGHPLLANRSVWRQFPTIRCGRWGYQNCVLMGDAVHTAHYSIGSGTKLAMEDAIALFKALEASPDVPTALAAYEQERRSMVESIQRAAQVSLTWFEETERYYEHLEPLDFAFSLLTRSLRLTHETLWQRDPKLMTEVDRRVAERASRQTGVALEQVLAPQSRLPGGERRMVGEAVGRKYPPPMFLPFRLRELTLSNRVVVSPMCQYSATDGLVNDWHLVHLGALSQGGAGLVLTEMTDVHPDGRITPGCAGMYRPEHVQAWKRIVDFTHAHSSARIGMQLAHAGRKGSCTRPWEGDHPLAQGWQTLGPSPIPYAPGWPVPFEMSRSDMDQVLVDFVQAAELADEAGFDLIEVHMAHGYLLNSFLSPISNVRTDAYGGSLENRMRFPLEVFAAVRGVWPDHKPISVRISATDWVPGGFNATETVQVAAALKAAGCDILDVSAGGNIAEQKPVYGRLFQVPFAERVRLEVDMPTMSVGAISSWTDVNSIIAAGRADLCCLARAHLFDPYWTRHAASEQGWPLPWPVQYQSVERFAGRMR